MSSSLSKMFSSVKIDLKSPTTILLILAVVALIWCLYKYNKDLTMITSSMEDGSEETKESSEQQPAQETPAMPAQTALSGSDLMPKDENKDHPALNSLSANVPDVLSAGQHLGATSQSLRNANLQVRSDPQIPSVDTGPWNKSTIEPDLGRVPLELGIIAN